MHSILNIKAVVLPDDLMLFLSSKGIGFEPRGKYTREYIIKLIYISCEKTLKGIRLTQSALERSKALIYFDY
jgi:hypothetical protein